MLLIALVLAAALPDSLTKSIASGNQDWIVGLEQHDAARIAAPYEEKAINCSAASECGAGRAAIQQQMEARVAKLGAVKNAWVKSSQTALDGELAYEWGRAGSTAGGKEFAGRYMTVWSKQADGSWKIFRNLSLP